MACKIILEKVGLQNPNEICDCANDGQEAIDMVQKEV